jgi:hypothetical protein
VPDGVAPFFCVVTIREFVKDANDVAGFMFLPSLQARRFLQSKPVHPIEALDSILETQREHVASPMPLPFWPTYHFSISGGSRCNFTVIHRHVVKFWLQVSV